MQVTLLREADYRRQRWKNDAGWTSELARGGAPDASDFDWRVSIAEIERDGPFSPFPGYDRHIALLDGAGMRLEFDAAQPVLLEQPLRFVAFRGEWHAYGALLAGPVRDVNVMIRRDRVSAEVLHRPLVGTMVFLSQADTTWFVHLAAGRATFKRGRDGDALPLQARESLLLTPDAARESCVLDGGGDLVLVKLTPVAS